MAEMKASLKESPKGRFKQKISLLTISLLSLLIHLLAFVYAFGLRTKYLQKLSCLGTFAYRGVWGVLDTLNC